MKEYRKKILAGFLSLCLLPCLLFSSCGEELPRLQTSDSAVSYTVSRLGQPYGEMKNNAAIPWDLFFYDGFLYVGAGDFDINDAPPAVRRYHFASARWEDCGQVPDEQINRFLLLDGILTIPGTDPHSDSWEIGNYYVLENGTFVTHAVLPNAVHTFDMTLFHGKYFAAIGTDKSFCPLLVSLDKTTFTPVPFTVDGQPFSGSPNDPYNRIYDLFVYKDALYVIYHDLLFQYREEGEIGVFEAVTDWSGQVQIASGVYVPILAKTACSDYYCFTTGFFYIADNLGTLNEWMPEGYDFVSDLCADGDTLYLLCHKALPEGYKTAVLRLTLPADEEISLADVKKTGFETVFTLTYALPAFSFCKIEEDFILGMGKLGESSDKTGEIFLVRPEA